MTTPIAYLRDLDGDGISFHPCAKGDPGAFPVYGPEMPKDTSPDAALFISKEAFHKGFRHGVAAANSLDPLQRGYPRPEYYDRMEAAAWSDFEPSETAKGMS